MRDPATTAPDARGVRLAIVTSRYHPGVTDALRDGAVQCFQDAGGDRRHLRHLAAPGAWELVVLARAAAEVDAIDGVVALGCIVTGETRHDEHLARAVAGGLTEIVVRSGKPVGFGVLTCASAEQAAARAGGERGNKGVEAMTACLHAIGALRELAGSRA